MSLKTRVLLVFDVCPPYYGNQVTILEKNGPLGEFRNLMVVRDGGDGDDGDSGGGQRKETYVGCIHFSTSVVLLENTFSA